MVNMELEQVEFGILEPSPREVERESWPEPGPSPYLSVEAGAGCVEPHVDEHYSDGCYLWLELIVADGDLDLEADTSSESSENYPPRWLDYLVGEFGLRDMLHLECEDVLDWSIREGIAPHQPFLVWCSRLRSITYHSLDYGTDYDLEWDCEVVRKLPTTMGAREYESFINRIWTARHETDPRGWP